MEAILLGAGLGTRLVPITHSLPKVLLPVLQRPLLLHILDYLAGQGVTKVAMNLHHLAGQVNRCLKEEYAGKAPVAINFENEILGTGGGIQGLKPYVGADDFIVYNGDVVTDIDITQAWSFHRRHRGLATLILHDFPGLNMVYVGSDDRIYDIRNQAGQGTKATRTLAFTGISILSRRIFDLLPAAGYADIINLYLRLLAEGKEKIMGQVVAGHYWRDIGNLQSYWQLHRELLLGQTKLPVKGYKPPPTAHYIHPQAQVAPNCLFKGFAAVYQGSHLQQGVFENCVILPDTTVGSPCHVKDSIVGPDYILPVGDPA